VKLPVASGATALFRGGGGARGRGSSGETGGTTPIPSGAGPGSSVEEALPTGEQAGGDGRSDKAGGSSWCSSEGCSTQLDPPRGVGDPKADTEKGNIPMRGNQKK